MNRDEDAGTCVRGSRIISYIHRMINSLIDPSKEDKRKYLGNYKFFMNTIFTERVKYDMRDIVSAYNESLKIEMSTFGGKF